MLRNLATKLVHIFRFQDKKWRMHSPDTAKKTTITRYIPAAACVSRRGRGSWPSEHAYILDGLSQRGLLVGARQAPPYRADLVDERHGRRARAVCPPPLLQLAA